MRYTDACRPREIQNLVQADSDLSKSPHVIHLTHDDAQVGVAEPSPERNEILPESRIDRDTPCPGPFLPPTLETRKKKKRADLSDAPGDSTAQTEQSDSKVETAQPVISGSKRKFSPDDDGFLADLAPEDDEFQFSRPSRSPQKQSDPFEFMRQDLSPSTTPMTMKRGSANHGITKRKVLEPSMASSHAWLLYTLTNIAEQRVQILIWAHPKKPVQLYTQPPKCHKGLEWMRTQSLP